jgi:mRNA interferase RelE/StbE
LAYSIAFAAGANRQFDKLPRPAQCQLGALIAALADNPRPPGVVKLSGEDGLYRVRGGDYRAIYRIEDARLLILVVKVGHRRDIYR